MVLTGLPKIARYPHVDLPPCAATIDRLTFNGNHRGGLRRADPYAAVTISLSARPQQRT
jgi:hypothetical protein